MHDVITQRYHVGAMQVLGFAEEAPVLDAAVFHFDITRRVAIKIVQDNFFAFVLGHPRCLRSPDALPHKHADADVLHRRTLGFDGQAIFQRQRLAHAFFRREPGEPDIEAENPKIVDAKFIQRCLNVVLKPNEHGSHDNRHKHADHHAQHRQERPHFVRPDGLQGHLNVFRKQF